MADRVRAPRRPQGTPPATEVAGRAVQWGAWALTQVCSSRNGCPRCRRPGRTHWAAYGRLDPLPGERWVVDGRRVPARPVLPVVAYWCPRCQRTRTIHLNETQAQQLALFPTGGDR
jgi:hypothetical protein